MILNDKQIIELAREGAISGFIEDSVRRVIAAPNYLDNSKPHWLTGIENGRRKVISYGVSSYGYDVRLGEDVKIFRNTPQVVPVTRNGANTTESINEIDPKRFDPRVLYTPETLTDIDGAKYVQLPGYSYLLGHTPEIFNLPRDIIIHCLGKSTYARSAISVNITPIEPGFEGQVVIEVTNHCGLPVRIYLNEGIAQFAFFRGEPCEVSYADRAGKYQGQRGVQLPIV